MDTSYKVYAEILWTRLDKQLEGDKRLDDTQYSFRKGRGTMHAIYILKKAIGTEIKMERGNVGVYDGP